MMLSFRRPVMPDTELRRVRRDVAEYEKLLRSMTDNMRELVASLPPDEVEATWGTAPFVRAVSTLADDVRRAIAKYDAASPQPNAEAD